MNFRRRVVITGLGVVSACGLGWRAFWDKAKAGESSLRPFPEPLPGDFPVRLAGVIENFAPGDLIRQRKSIKVMSRDTQLAVAASSLALQDANLVSEALNLDACGVCLGSGAPINTDLDGLSSGVLKAYANGRFSMELFGREGIPALFPLWFLKDIPNMPACHISIAHGFRGPNNTMTTSAAAGLQGVGEAARVIERGDAECMLAGGTDSEVNPLGLSRFEMLSLFSKKTEIAAPFSKNTDGFYPGEGAGLLVLESLEHALARGARIYAEISGYGSAADGNTDPENPSDPGGRSRAMKNALRDAGISFSELSGIFACGAGIPAHDRLEEQAFASFNLKIPPVTALKTVAGHMMTAAGGVEAAAACASLAESFFPPMAGGAGVSLSGPNASVLVNAFGLSGQNASLVLKKFSGEK